MVTCADDQIGRIAAALDKKGLSKNTLIVFSSDNGGPLGSGATNGKLRAGKGTLYEGGTRVTAFANWPGQVKAGAINNEPLHIVDWFPTLVKLAGGSLEQKLPLDGRDAWATITAGRPSPHADILLNTTPANGAVRAGDWKLVLNGSHSEIGPESPGPKAAKGKKGKVGKAGKAAANRDGESVELFNLAADPYEKTNLAAEQPEKVHELKARLAAYAAEAAPPKSGPQAPGFQVPKVWGE
jgi:arylsulfatase A-like enzyme